MLVTIYVAVMLVTFQVWMFLWSLKTGFFDPLGCLPWALSGIGAANVYEQLQTDSPSITGFCIAVSFLAICLGLAALVLEMTNTLEMFRHLLWNALALGKPFQYLSKALLQGSRGTL